VTIPLWVIAIVTVGVAVVAFTIGWMMGDNHGWNDNPDRREKR
jgi:hypothetical protein